MAVIFQDGFESGDFSAWNSTAGTPFVQGVVFHHGAFAAATDSNLDSFTKIYAATTVLFTRFYWRITTLPNVNSGAALFIAYDAGNVKRFEIGYQNAAGVYRWYLHVPPTDVLYFQTLNLNQWYCVEAEYNADTDTHRLWIDGVLVATSNQVMTAALVKSNFGLTNAWSWVTVRYWDCFVFDDANYIGVEGAPPVNTALWPSHELVDVHYPPVVY